MEQEIEPIRVILNLTTIEMNRVPKTSEEAQAVYHQLNDFQRRCRWDAGYKDGRRNLTRRCWLAAMIGFNTAVLLWGIYTVWSR